MKELLITRYGRTYKVVVSEYRCRLELVRPTVPMFIEGDKVFVSPDAKIEYMYTKDDVATLLCAPDLSMVVGVEGNRHNFYLKKVHGRMYRVYKLYLGGKRYDI